MTFKSILFSFEHEDASEYQPDLMGRQDAENAVKWAERIIFKVKDKLKLAETN